MTRFYYSATTPEAERLAMQKEIERLEQQIENLKDNNWPFEWVVATEERKKRKEAEQLAHRLQQEVNYLHSELGDYYEFCDKKRNEARQTIAFFASVIRSGEPWTEECQKEFDEVMRSLA